MKFPILSILVLLPVIAGLLLMGGKFTERFARKAAAGLTTLLLLLVLGAAVAFEPGDGFQLVERYSWASALGLEYYLAADGISLVFVLLTPLVFIMSLLAARGLAVDARYYGWMLILQGMLLGTFTAQNFLHFFLFWELALIPAFFLIRTYGGAQRNRASIQFFIYTMAGSIAMLLAFLALFAAAGTFDFAELASRNSSLGLELSTKISVPGLTAEGLGTAVFLLALAGVAVKVPIWPFHGWQPLAYSEAPAPVAMVLTGIMSKMGVYGLIRLILPIFPREIDALHEPLLILAVVTILYGALAAFAQTDLKRLFAYSSLSHLGYCFLGIFAAAGAGGPDFTSDRAAAVNGVVLQVLSHGIIGAALFGFVGFLERRNGGLRSIEHFGGLRAIQPQFAGLMGILIFASLGLPGLSGFPAEFLIFKGAFTFAPVASAFAVLGLLFTAVYLLTFFGRVFFGPLNPRQAGREDLTLAEKSAVLPAIGAAFLLGIAPQIVVAIFNPSVTRLVQQIAF